MHHLKTLAKVWPPKQYFARIHIARSIEEIRSYRSSLLARSVGFVPTMGALHSGHLYLMELAKRENDICVSSIFVNPTQFGIGEDFEKYPRHLEKDIELLNSLDVDCLFSPSMDDIYPTAAGSLCHVEPLAFQNILEGKARPQFFRGVATIVCKLFNIVQPTTAYFGQKDISQAILIRRLVHDLNIPVKIRVIETVRESDGLAMSSRNAYLSPQERKVADVLYRALNSGKRICEAVDGGRSSLRKDEVVEAIDTELRKEKLVSLVEYISVASHIDMNELSHVEAAGAVLSSAIRVGPVRLIDNILVGKAYNDVLGV